MIKTEVIPATGEVSDKKETVIFTGSAKTSGWGQAITLSTTKEGGSFDSSVIEKDGYFEVQFKGGTDKAEIILQSWSGGADWARVSPTEVTEKDGIVYAKYSYDDVAAAFGTTDFSKVDRFHVGAANGDIEVLSVKYIVGKSTKPVDPVDPVDPDKPEQDPYVSIFWGAKSCGSWGQAVSVMTSKIMAVLMFRIFLQMAISMLSIQVQRTSLSLFSRAGQEEQTGQEFSLAKQAERMIITMLSSHMQTV